MKHQTLSRSDVILKIKDTAARLNVPGSHLFKRLFMERQNEIKQERSDLLREREKVRRIGFNAASRVLAHEFDDAYLPKKPSGTYLSRIKD